MTAISTRCRLAVYHYPRGRPWLDAVAGAINASQLPVTGLSFTYRYLIGFDAPLTPELPDSQCPRLSAWLVPDKGLPIGSGTKVWTSPALRGPYRYTKCKSHAESCYSPPISVRVNGLRIKSASPLYFRLQADNGCCNLQIPIRSDHGLKLSVQLGYPHRSHRSTSVGSTVLMVAGLGLALPYLALGAIYQRRRHGATGVEMIPNRGFWRQFFALSFEGCQFVLACCSPRGAGRSVSGYSRYDML